MSARLSEPPRAVEDHAAPVADGRLMSGIATLRTGMPRGVTPFSAP